MNNFILRISKFGQGWPILRRGYRGGLNSGFSTQNSRGGIGGDKMITKMVRKR